MGVDLHSHASLLGVPAEAFANVTIPEKTDGKDPSYRETNAVVLSFLHKPKPGANNHRRSIQIPSMMGDTRSSTMIPGRHKDDHSAREKVSENPRDAPPPETNPVVQQTTTSAA